MYLGLHVGFSLQLIILKRNFNALSRLVYMFRLPWTRGMLSLKNSHQTSCGFCLSGLAELAVHVQVYLYKSIARLNSFGYNNQFNLNDCYFLLDRSRSRSTVVNLPINVFPVIA